MAAEMRGPKTGGGGGSRPGINRRLSVFDMATGGGGGSGGAGSGRASVAIASPPRRSSGRPSMPVAASFSVGSTSGLCRHTFFFLAMFFF